METLTLEQALSEEKIVLVDTSVVTSTPSVGPLGEKLYGCCDYGDIDLDEILSAREEIQSSSLLLDNSSFKVIPEVVQEIRQFCQILNNSANYFNDRDKFSSEYLRFRAKMHCEGYAEKRQAFLDLCFDANKLLKRARNIVCKTETLEYSNLLNFIEFITEKFYFKNSDAARLNRREPKAYRKEKEDHHTDQKMVAALFANALAKSDSRIAVVSKDHHIYQMFKRIYHVISSGDFNGYNQRFLEAMQKNPPRIYIIGCDYIGSDHEKQFSLPDGESCKSFVPDNSYLGRKFFIPCTSTDEFFRFKGELTDFLSSLK